MYDWILPKEREALDISTADIVVMNLKGLR